MQNCLHLVGLHIFSLHQRRIASVEKNNKQEIDVKKKFLAEVGILHVSFQRINYYFKCQSQDTHDDDLKNKLTLDLPKLLHLLFPLLLFLLSLLVFLELSFLFIPFFSISRLFLRCQVRVALCFCFLQAVYDFINFFFHRYDLHLHIRAFKVSVSAKKRQSNINCIIS